MAEDALGEVLTDHLESTSKATVSIDGKPRGMTPLVGLELPPGEHTVVLSSKKPRVELEQTITVTEGETKKLSVKLKRK